MHPEFVLGVDIGGSHITAALVDTSSVKVLPGSHCRIAIDSTADAAQIIGSWAATIRLAWEKAGGGVTAVGMAMPGPFDYAAGICLITQQQKYRSLYGLNIKQLLAKRLGISSGDILFINDASSFLKGELVAGSMQGHDEAVGLTLGTGLGAAHFSRQQVHDAALWQMPFKNGMAEDFLSTRWFVQACQHRAGLDVAGVKELVEQLSNHVHLRDIFSDFAKNLAEFIPLVCSNLRCSNVVIGGNITRAADLFWQQTIEVLKHAGCEANLKIASLGEQASLIGAASLFMKENATNNKIA